MPTLSKRIRSAREHVDRLKNYPLNEAVETLGRFPKAKFDETVELSVHLGVDPRQTNQMVRGTVNLPNGSGKSVRVIVFTDDAEAALAAGADEAGMDDLIAKVQEGWLEFDVAVSTVAGMKEVRKVARVLGPRGLMPNPKSGTVTDDIAGALKDIKQGGRVEFKMDKTANMAIVVGKRSFSSEQLVENIQTVIDTLSKLRPDGLKGARFIKTMAVSGTMTPSVRLDQSIFANF
jgi:large subunit ribosomal protein L1